jgi:hypothetical protein
MLNGAYSVLRGCHQEKHIQPALAMDSFVKIAKCHLRSPHRSQQSPTATTMGLDPLIRFQPLSPAFSFKRYIAKPMAPLPIATWRKR